MKIRLDSTLASFTQEQLASLYDWILASRSYADAQARALKPAPDGFGLHIHITTLRRFYQDYTTWLREEEAAEQLTANPAQLVAAAETEVAHAIHTLAHSPSDATHLKLVTTFLHQQRETALKDSFLQLAKQHAAVTQERLALERERMAEQKRQWEFNVGRELMKNLVELQKIHRLPGIDDEEKIWKARQIAFGRAPQSPSDARE
jgi:hypothetical protein